MSDYEKVKELIVKFNKKEIDYFELSEQARPIIDDMNRKNRQIAQKMGMKAKFVNLQSIMRNTY